ncbi:MAG: hypothetical protein WCZ90_06415 [Melioribacteraceae bacterium]
MKCITLLFFVFVSLIYSQTHVGARTQIIELDALKDTNDTLLENQPYGARPNQYLKKSIRVGEIVLNGTKYKCALYYFLNRKNYDYAHLWIDTIVNGKYDYWEDFLEEVWHPVTLFGTSYMITNVDSLGYRFTLKECDQKEYPPIQVGKKAPNIIFTTTENKKLELYSFTKKYKVLFFWSCTAAYHAEEMVKVVNHFKGKNIDFINSSWNPYEGEKKGNPWTHFYNLTTDKERMIYQVGSLMKMFVIDENNYIVSIVDGYEEATDLIEKIEKSIL